MMRAVLSTGFNRTSLMALLAFAGCSAPAAPLPPSRAATLASSEPTAAATVAPIASAAPVLPAPRITFEPILDKALAGNTEPDAISMSFLDLPDALLVVVNMPSAAFLVRGTDLQPLPHFFDGIRSPDPASPADYFAVDGLKGTLLDLTFDVYAPATEYRDVVHGKPGHWQNLSGRRSGAKAKQPSWVEPTTISEPFATKNGARIYETSRDENATARDGFVFRFDGPSKGEKLPLPLPGKNGCRYAMLGHPMFTQTADGALFGLGTLCVSGDQELSTARLDGLAPPLQTIGPRLTEGPFAVERWVGSTSVVLPLPGAEHGAQFAYFNFAHANVGDRETLYVVTQVAGARGSEGYAAELVGTAFENITPPNPPEMLLPFVSKAGQLYLLHQTRRFCRDGSTWTEIALEHSKECALESMAEAIEAHNGDLFLSGPGGCLWFLRAGASRATRVDLGDGAFLQSMFVHQDDLYAVLFAADGPRLTRVRY